MLKSTPVEFKILTPESIRLANDALTALNELRSDVKKFRDTRALEIPNYDSTEEGGVLMHNIDRAQCFLRDMLEKDIVHSHWLPIPVLDNVRNCYFQLKILYEKGNLNLSELNTHEMLAAIMRSINIISKQVDSAINVMEVVQNT
jgi:hypothetical protein